MHSGLPGLRRRWAVALWMSTLLLTGAVHADDASDLVAVYKLALVHDTQLLARFAQIQAAKEGASQSQAALLPNIGIAGSISRSSVETMQGSGAVGTTAELTTKGWQAKLTQPLFNLESLFNIKQAWKANDEADLTLAAEQQSLIMRVSEAYFSVLRAEDTLTTTRAEENAVKLQFTQTEQRFRVGLVAQADVHEARAAWDASQVARIQAENLLDQAMEKMSTLTNTTQTGLVKLDMAMPVVSIPPEELSNWVKMAVENSLELRIAQAKVEVSRAGLNAARSGYAPVINAVVSYSDSTERNSELPAKMRTRGHAYGVELSFSLFSGGYTTSKVREAAYLREASQHNSEGVERKVKADARSLFRTVNADAKRVGAGCFGIQSADSALQATQSGYDVGTRHLVDVLSAQRNLYSARRDYLNARYDFILNGLRLKRVAGTLGPQDLQELNVWIRTRERGDLLPVCSKL